MLTLAPPCLCAWLSRPCHQGMSSQGPPPCSAGGAGAGQGPRGAEQAQHRPPAALPAHLGAGHSPEPLPAEPPSRATTARTTKQTQTGAPGNSLMFPTSSRRAQSPVHSACPAGPLPAHVLPCGSMGAQAPAGPLPRAAWRAHSSRSRCPASPAPLRAAPSPCPLHQAASSSLRAAPPQQLTVRNLSENTGLIN